MRGTVRRTKHVAWCLLDLLPPQLPLRRLLDLLPRRERRREVDEPREGPDTSAHRVRACGVRRRAEGNSTLLRPIRGLGIWISEGLPQADSYLQGVGFRERVIDSLGPGAGAAPCCSGLLPGALTRANQETEGGLPEILPRRIWVLYSKQSLSKESAIAQHSPTSSMPTLRDSRAGRLLPEKQGPAT